MTVDEVRAFVQANHRAVLATLRTDGRTQLTPVTVAVMGDGRLGVSTRETAAKVRNLRRDPRVSICLLPDEFFGEWHYVDGTAEVVSLPEAMELLVEYYRNVSGEHPDWDDYRAAMERDLRVMILVTVERAGPTSHG